MDGDTLASSSSTAIPLAPSRNGRASGKPWKTTKTAVRRSYISPSIKSSFEKRKDTEKKREAVRMVEKEMKDEKVAEVERKRANIKERKERIAEKERLEQIAAKMSAKKLQRMKKRLGRSKKISG